MLQNHYKESMSYNFPCTCFVLKNLRYLMYLSLGKLFNAIDYAATKRKIVVLSIQGTKSSN